MPENEIQEKQVVQNENDAEVVKNVLEYLEEKHNPWRGDYVNILVECYNFKELKQWEGDDMAALALADVPTISVDRIGRGLDTIQGIRYNTGNKKKIVKRESGDYRIADILDAAADYVDYNADFGWARDESFDAMLSCGLGIRKIGYDPEAMGGEGMFWSEAIKTEDVYWASCKKKTLEDALWVAHVQTMNWEEAIRLNPDRAGEIKMLKTQLESTWEKEKGGNTTGTLLTADYGVTKANAEKAYSYPDSVKVVELWKKKISPVSKVASVRIVFDEMGIPRASVDIRYEDIAYAPIETETVLAKTVVEQWYQYVVLTGRDRSGLLLSSQPWKYRFHPFIGMCAEWTKSGRPIGFIEKVKDHQKRINIAWAQKTAWNNKSIKSPIVADEGAFDLQNGIQGSRLGSILWVKTGKKVHMINQVPNIDLQAIEEGNIARQDLDFAAAATEAPLRGVADSGSSGVRFAQQQSAAVTPINKYVKAEADSERLFWRKILEMMILEFTPERYARILGEQRFMELLVGKTDPFTGMPIELPLQFPPRIDVAQYDVIIEDKAVSDLNKQQAFNATLALHQSGIVFDDEFLIRQAPIKNTDEALVSNRKAKQDMLRQIIAMQVQGQQANAVRGKNQPQNGRQSMIGGMSPNTVV